MVKSVDDTAGLTRAALVAVAVGFVASGATGVAWQVVWTRLLTVVLGAGAWAHAVTLATFFGGLALGSALGGVVADRRPTQLLGIWAALEVVIGVWGLATPGLAVPADAMWSSMVSGAGGGLGGILRIVPAALLVLVPTIAMGATTPVVGRAIVTRSDRTGADIAWLYALNAAGAAGGALLAGLALLPWIGVQGTAWTVGGINLAIGLVAAGFQAGLRGLGASDEDDDLDAKAAPDPPTEGSGLTTEGIETPGVFATEGSEVPPGEHTTEGSEIATSTLTEITTEGSEITPGEHTTEGSGLGIQWTLALAAAAIGFASLTLEIAWTRLFSIVFGSSTRAFTLMLVAFLVGIGGGGLAANRWLGRRPHDGARLIRGLLVAAVAVLTLQLPLYERLPHLQFSIAWAFERRADVYPLYLATQTVVATLWMLPLTLCTGAMLPTLVHLQRRDVQHVGRDVGALFAANTVGTVLGPLLAGFVLLPVLGLQGTIVVAIAVLAAVGAGFAGATAGGANREDSADGGETRSSRPWTRALWIAPVLVASVMPAWDPAVMHAGGFRRWTMPAGVDFATFRSLRTDLEVVYAHDGTADSVVLLRNVDGELYLKVNGKTDASDAPDLATQRYVGHLPVLLHEAATGDVDRSVYVVGVGSGVTVGAAARHDAHVVGVELSRGVLEASRWFEHVHGGLENRDDVEVHLGDAREWLRRDPRRWDVIINQPSNPWIAGNAALFSREFFELTRDRLADGGVVAQWMHVYAMDDASLELVIDTFRSVFPHVTLWSPQAVDLVLIGSLEPLDVDLDHLAEALARPAIHDDLADSPREGLRVHTLPRLLATQVMAEGSLAERFDAAPPWTTDLMPRLEAQAAVAQFIGHRATMLDDLDDRTSPMPTGLHIEDLRLTDADRQDLLAFFADRQTPWATRLAGSLQHAVASQRPGPAVMADMTTRATGLPGLLEVWADEVAASATLDVATCHAFVDALATRLPVRATILYRPPIDRWQPAIDRCRAVDARYTDVLWARLLVDLGHFAAAERAIDRLLGERLPEAVRTELESARDRARAAIDR